MSINVEFPLEGWVAVLAIYKYDGGRVMYPLYSLFTSTKMVCDRAEAIKKEIADQDLEVGSELKLIPVRYKRKFELKREYWAKPTVKYTQSNRIDEFTRLLDRPAFYELLVTPAELVDNKFALAAALPIVVNDDATVELFMKMSDFVVSERAAAAAIYAVGEPFTLNWQTGEMARVLERSIYPWTN